MFSASQLMDWRTAQDQRAKGFHRTRTLRRFLSALLAHVTKERLLQWDHQELAQKHNHRCASRDFSHMAEVLGACFLRNTPNIQRVKLKPTVS